MKRSVSLEFVLYLGLALLAAGLRVAALDASPLNDLEATAALSAIDAGSNPVQSVPTSAAYRVVTAAVFSLFGSSEAAARVFPALAGVLLVLTPLLVRRQFGNAAALIAAVLFSISPTLWTVSRTASGSSLSVLAVGLAAFFWLQARDEPHPNLELAAGAGGLAIVSGPGGLGGLLSLGLAWLTFAAFRRRRAVSPASSQWSAIGSVRSLGTSGLIAAGVVILAVGSGAGFFPTALRTVFDGIGVWAAGWVQRSGPPLGSVLLQLPAYEPLVLVFGAAGLITALRRNDELQLWLASWTIGSLAVLAIDPSREPADVIWVVIPMILLAAPRLAHVIEHSVGARPIWVLLGATAGVLALLGFTYFQLRGYVAGANAAQTLLGIPALLTLAWMGIVLAIIALSLVATGWSVDLAERVAGLAALVALLLLTISAGTTLNRPEPSGSELWRSQTATLGLFELRDSLATLSDAQTGQPNALPVETLDSPSPAFAWVLRDYRRFDPATAEDELPPVILAREGAELPGGYLGQSLVIGEERVWTGAYPPALLAWWLNRSGPTAQEGWVLLVRQDVARVEEPAQ